MMYTDSELETIATAKHLLERKLEVADTFQSMSDLVYYLKTIFAKYERQVFVVLFLKPKMQLLATEELFFGSIAEVDAYHREVVRRALHHNASSVIVAHNRPMNNVIAGDSDKFSNADLKETLARVEIRLLDHFIIGTDTHLSFVEEGLM